MSKPQTPRIGLQIKIVVGLLMISMVPLLVSALVIDEIAEVSEIYGSNEAARVREPLVKAAPIYRELIKTKKDFYQQTAYRYAAEPATAAIVDGPGSDASRRHLDSMLQAVPELYRAAVVDADGVVVIERVVSRPTGVGERYSAKQFTAPVGTTGARLRLTFAADAALVDDLKELGTTIDQFKHVDRMRASLPQGYRRSFLAVVGGVVVIVTLAGYFLSRRLTRRIALLVTHTRKVAAGDLEARVALKGRDELAELGSAFNRMLEDLAHDRQQIAYLQRVGAWQDVARKLAHEIKNPLTPIQLAVQQCVSSYDGDDDRYRRLLGDAEEIVGEEIANLRRLVDAFRTLGQLPKVEAAPLDLGTIMDDLTKDPGLLAVLELDAPDEPVMVRGDRLLLRRVLTNLIENGRQAGEGIGRDGKVVVCWRSDLDSERVDITVDDEGPGIKPDDRDRIFEPYITTKDTGTGLGLTISKKIALEHGGALELAPGPSPLGGARFRLSLPLPSLDDEESVAET